MSRQSHTKKTNMYKKFFAMVFICMSANCAHSTELTTGLAVTGGIAGLGLNYLALYGISRASFASALAEHREQMGSNSNNTTNREENQERANLNRGDTDRDGVPDHQDRCPREHRGRDRFVPSERDRWMTGQPSTTWLAGCPVTE